MQQSVNHFVFATRRRGYGIELVGVVNCAGNIPAVELVTRGAACPINQIIPVPCCGYCGDRPDEALDQLAAGVGVTR